MEWKIKTLERDGEKEGGEREGEREGEAEGEGEARLGPETPEIQIGS